LLRQTVRRAEIPEGDAAHLVPILIQKLKDGQAILLIDGIDEIMDTTLRASFCQQIEQMRLAHPDAPIIVTARIVGYREMGQRIGRGFEHLTVGELSTEDKDEFVNLWCSLTETGVRRHEAAAELIREIHSTDRIERLTTNPMLLTTIALVKRKVGRLPSHRVDLYGDALAVLINWRREVEQPLDWYEAVPQLGYLAYSMCNRGVLQLRKDEILQLLQTLRTQYASLYAIHTHTPEQFLNLLERLTGVLTQVGTIRHVGLSTPVYEFRHLTFQEYLAARALIDGCYPDRDRTKSLADTIAPLAGRLTDEKDARNDRDVSVSESWSETLRLCVAACPNDDVDGVIRAIAHPYAGEDHRATKRPRSVLASLCLADDPNVSEEVVREVIEQLVSEIDHRDGNEGTDTGISSAIKELSTSRWAGILRSTLLETFCRTNSAYRSNLGFLYGTVVTNSLDLEPEDTRMAWVENEFTRLFFEDKRDQVDALLSINAVSRHHQVTAPQRLIERLLAQLTHSAPVALAAASTLATLNSDKQKQAAWKPLPQELDTIIKIIDAEETEISVVENLLTIVSNEKDSRALKSVLARLDEPNLQLAAVKALGRIGGKDIAARLVPLINARDHEIQLAAINALGHLSDKSSVTPLILLLTGSRDDIRLAAVEALGQFNDERVVAALIERLNDPNSDVRRAVLDALHRLRKSEYRDIYISKLDDDSPTVRVSAARHIRGSNDPRAVEILLSKLNDHDGAVQAAVALALAESRDARVVQPLINLLSSDNDMVYLATCFALGGLKDRAAIKYLIAGLDSPHFMRKFPAAMALGWLGDQEALDPLLTRLVDKRDKVPTIFVSTVAKFKDPRAFEPLVHCSKRQMMHCGQVLLMRWAR
jgi:HEAT repeat protein